MEMMPEFSVFDIKPGKLGIMPLTESSDTLSRHFLFSENEKKEYLAIKNENRKREYIAVRLLMKKMSGKKTEISYDSNGKPLLEDSPLKVSISHSADLAIVALSEKNIGADVENINRNTERVAVRFLSEAERECIRNSPVPSLLQVLYWSAKEAAFKFCEVPEVEFKTHIVIQPFEFNPAGGTFRGTLCKKVPATELAFNYLFHQNNVIVYCVESI